MNKPTTKKKEQVSPKKQPLPLHSITYSCVCGTKFETVSTSKNNFSVSSCSRCNPFYTGAPAHEVRVGAVAKFRQKFGSPKKS